MIYAPVVKVVTRKVYADPGQDEALLDCYVHGEPKPSVSDGEALLKKPIAKVIGYSLKVFMTPKAKDSLQLPRIKVKLGNCCKVWDLLCQPAV